MESIVLVNRSMQVPNFEFQKEKEKIRSHNKLISVGCDCGMKWKCRILFFEKEKPDVFSAISFTLNEFILSFAYKEV